MHLSIIEFERVVAFYESDPYLEISHPYRHGRALSDELVRLILSGSSPTELGEWINQEELRLRAARALSVERHNFAIKAMGGVASVFGWLGYVLWTPFRLIGRLVSDVYHMWKLFNSSCPAAPPSEKGSFV